MTKSKLNKKKISYWTKLLLRSCLVAVFVILLSLFGIITVCFCDSLYNESKGNDKNPLLNAYVIVTEVWFLQLK